MTLPAAASAIASRSGCSRRFPRGTTGWPSSSRSGQNGRWRRAMVDQHRAGRRASGARRGIRDRRGRAPARRPDRRGVVGVDLTEQMLRPRVSAKSAAAGRAAGSRLVAGRAEQLPFPDRSFDALTFTYLLRYVQDPQATLAELARVVKPGGRVASLEFLLPPVRCSGGSGGGCTPGCCCPVGGCLTGGREWYDVGRFLGPNISGHYRRYPVAGPSRPGGRPASRTSAYQVMSLGGGPRHVGNAGRWLTGAARARQPDAAGTGRRGRPHGMPGRPTTPPARARWRDWWTLLHPPYTAWHLSYVVIGAAWRRGSTSAPARHAGSPSSSPSGCPRTRSTSCRGRPLRTRIPSRR